MENRLRELLQSLAELHDVDLATPDELDGIGMFYATEKLIRELAVRAREILDSTN